MNFYQLFDELQALVGQRRIAVIALLLTAFIAISVLISIIVSWLPMTTPQQSAAPSSLQQHAEDLNLSMAQLPQWHLFGLAVATDKHGIPTTKLTLILRGILNNTKDPQQSSAIISVPGQSDKIFRTGDTLPGGAILYRIEQTKIILKNHNQLEELPLLRPRINWKKLPLQRNNEGNKP